MIQLKILNVDKTASKWLQRRRDSKKQKQKQKQKHKISHFYFYFCHKWNLGLILFIFIHSLINSKSNELSPTDTEFWPPVLSRTEIDEFPNWAWKCFCVATYYCVCIMSVTILNWRSCSAADLTMATSRNSYTGQTMSLLVRILTNSNPSEHLLHRVTEFSFTYGWNR